MATLAQLSQNMQSLILRLNSDTARVVRAVALAVDQAVVTATPVDTGRARSNWIASVGQPANQIIFPYDPGFGGSTGASNSQQAMDQARAVISSAPDNATIYISNNLPYIQRLNQGWSRQAPAGYIEKAVNAAAMAVKAAFP
jgi:hypothetical protein